MSGVSLAGPHSLFTLPCGGHGCRGAPGGGPDPLPGLLAPRPGTACWAEGTFLPGTGPRPRGAHLAAPRGWGKLGGCVSFVSTRQSGRWTAGRRPRPGPRFGSRAARLPAAWAAGPGPRRGRRRVAGRREPRGFRFQPRGARPPPPPRPFLAPRSPQPGAGAWPWRRGRARPRGAAARAAGRSVWATARARPGRPGGRTHSARSPPTAGAPKAAAAPAPPPSPAQGHRPLGALWWPSGAPSVRVVGSQNVPGKC